MRAAVMALAGFAGVGLACGDCDVRWIEPAQAQARNAVSEAGAPGYGVNDLAGVVAGRATAPGAAVSAAAAN